jgi:uncharacterized membrane protein YbhN (UPF0104 family)
MTAETTTAPGPSGRRNRLVRACLGAAVVVALAAYAWSERDQLEPLDDARPGEVLLIAALVVVGNFCNSTEFWFLYRAVGVRSTVMENWLLFAAGQLGNHVPGQLGTLYRLRYMRVVHATPYARSASVYGANFVVTLAGASLMGMIALGGSALTDGPAPLLLVAGFVTMGAAAIAAAIVPLPRFASRQGRLARGWQGFHEGWSSIVAAPRAGIAAIGLECAKYVVTAWRFQLAFSLIGIEESFWTFLVVAPTAGVAGFIAITPGAIGIREGLMAFAASAMGSTVSAGILGATIDRAVLLLTSLVLGGAGFLLTGARLRARPRDQGASAARAADMT